MTEILEVIVTEDDITEARRLCDGSISAQNHCPIALAVRRQFKCKYVQVNPGRIYTTWTTTTRAVYRLDTNGEFFVRKFDAGKPVFPTTIKATYIPQP